MDPGSASALEHAEGFEALKHEQKTVGTVERLNIPVGSTTVRGFLHLPAGYKENQDRISAAALLLSGAGGGVSGPSGIYVSIGDKLSSLRRGIPVLRLDYRYPADNNPCVEDVTSAMGYLDGKYSIRSYVLVGWSFGGAPVFTVGGQEKDRVLGCATVASQTAATNGIRYLAPRPVLLLHGTGDRTLNWHCSQSLYEAYGKKGDRSLKLFEGDDHALTKNSHEAEELLCSFIARCLDVGVSGHERESVLQKTLTKDGDKVDLMKKGGDLEGERVE
ncbi:hypothetical protein A1O7_05169 [Cladophialophora yegresii CBS 114405]|uniref:AB hydrolase-1 domain-containing protein n=1 Tax=Cladophialophora yegresii CBS 114405 TaxID=1182544 RepID=W9W906_9EURO|nr:uncharacterized protein A1O7_05169 [Cladophialophora yegresii CBS 114405]EXJ61016.1 hypothetical protein A1O7_05169 [Cladophialophora yegresii CBS 114405]